MFNIDSSIFRAYDIRGIVGDTLTEESVYAIGRALGSLVLESGETCIALARDGRHSGPVLSKKLCDGILTTGCDVIDLGMAPTPILYYATFVTPTRSGVMLTGSHNPADYNGLKMVVKGQTLSENNISALYQRIVDERFLNGKGQLQKMDLTKSYITEITQNISLNRRLKIVVDCGNGIAGNVVPELFQRLGCEVHPLFCEVDGEFPNHHPDPSQLDNLQDLIQKVRTLNADIGLAFDGDGDRLGVVTTTGEVIWPDRQLMLFAETVLRKNPGAKIIYDVKCTNHLDTLISTLGGEPIMWKTGHSFIKSKLAETDALLAGEMSGHIFFKDRWYGFDDAIYAGARLLEILAETAASCDEIFSKIPNSVNTPELKIRVADTEKFLLMEKLISEANFEEASINTIDGLRVNFADGWGLVRPSNTTPCLVLRFEAETETVLLKIKEMFREFLLGVQADLVLPF